MINELLNSILGNQATKKDEHDRGTGSLLVIGIILFILLGGLKLFQKPSDKTEKDADQQAGC